MRRLSSFLIAACLLLAACNSNKKPADDKTTTENNQENTTSNTNPMMNDAANMQKRTEELQKLPPLSLDQLKALIPEELMGAKKTNYTASSAMGAGVATAEYRMNDTTDVKLMVYDCGGPGGAGIYSMQYLGMFNMESESETEYTKTINFNGGRAIEHCQKTRNDCTLSYFTGSRFLVTLEGNNVGVEALKQAAGGLNIK